MAKIRYWAIFLGGILIAIVSADALANFLIAFSGLSDGTGFLAGFILYALLFFAILAVIERVTGVTFLGFSGHRD